MTSPTTFIPRGAILQELKVGNHNLVLNFHSAGEYANNPAHFGATIGRIANRVAGARIQQLDGRAWALEANNGENSLHGGSQGWGKKVWTPRSADDDGSEVFSYRSPHLDEGFPGDVAVSVRCVTRQNEVGRTEVQMDYEARLEGGAGETAVNITNHSYFNLSGADTIDGTEAWLGSNLHLPLDAGGIPISTDIKPYGDIDNQTAFALGKDWPEVDDCFVFPHAAADPGSVPLDTREGELRVCGKFWHPETKLHLEVASTEPAFQFYTGKYIDVDARPDGTPARGPRAGFCVEPSRFVDAVNREEWRSQVVLKPGEVYGSRIVYTAWIGGPDGVVGE
ncbi:putative carbohydrate binding protein [Geopyxis carbonaria]|nr:putative carbohydrate binding protein [Geopyxis carbonaria]